MVHRVSPDDAARIARFRPASGLESPRFSGVPTFMRLPALEPGAAGVEIGLFGIPFDGATTGRPGARLGPRAVRDASTGTRQVNAVSGIAPYALAACADLGDVAVNPIDAAETCRRIEAFVEALGGTVPLAVGGDHLVSYPVLRALGRDRPLGLVHIDAHSDTDDGQYGGTRFTHGTPFRRAVEDGALDPKRCVQIGLRGSLDALDERDWACAQGIRVVTMDEALARGLPEVVAEARAVVGPGPAYFSFDIDALDPAFAPGAGTPEIGGFTTREALYLLRGLRGLDLVGADLVEVAPPSTRRASPPTASITRKAILMAKPAPIRPRAISPACGAQRLACITGSPAHNSPPTLRRWRGARTTARCPTVASTQ